LRGHPPLLPSRLREGLGVGIRACLQRFGDYVHNAFQSLHHILIGKTQNSVAGVA